MRRIAPIVFALLSVLFVVERGINRGAFASHAPQVVGLQSPGSFGAGAECLPRDDVLQTLTLTGARLTPEPAPFCTDHADIAAWVRADEAAGQQHLAFDAQGCLVTWQETPCP